MPRGLSAFEMEEESRDRELTLGPMALAVLGLGLLAVCAVCFISGYAIGHRAPEQSMTPSAKEGPSAAQLFSAQPKPSATPATPQPTADAATPDVSTSDLVEAETSAAPASASGAEQHAAVVSATLPAQGNSTQAGTSTPPAVRSALPQGGAGSALWMVQIAVTANTKDAGLMVSDLRGKGVSVSMRRDASDGLIYVQAGPFSTHEEAAAMRQKVIAAGYNAIIQP